MSTAPQPSAIDRPALAALTPLPKLLSLSACAGAAVPMMASGTAKVRTWRAERRKATGATTTAKSYRLLKAIMQTAVEDELIRRNPCSILGAGNSATATVHRIVPPLAAPAGVARRR